MANANPDGSSLVSGPGPDASAVAAFNYAKATDTGNGDDPQFGENSTCGGSVRLGAPRFITVIPPLYRFLFPWQILPDPSPEQVEALAGRLAAQLQSASFRGSIAASLEAERGRLGDIVRGALPGRSS